jgi:hypothetical protein
VSSLLVLSPAGTSGGGAGQNGPIHIDGLVFRDEKGAIWPWKGITAFLAYQLWLIGGPAAVDPPVADYLSLPNRPNTLRVFGMIDTFARLHPQDWGPKYYNQLQPFMRYLFSRWSVRAEFVIFADAQIIMPDHGEQDAHAIRVSDLIGTEPNVFEEVANEPSAKLPGGDARAYEIYQLIKRPGRMIATGAGDGNYAGEYVTVHTPRDAEWPRKAKDLLDVRNIAHVPCVADEPMGADEVASGSRDTNPRNFADYAATAQLEGAGSTFHSQSGVFTRPLQPIQRQCAEAFFAAADWVPPEAQLQQFMRGAMPAGCNWTYAPGDAPSICQHDDAIETRSYGKILEPQCYVVQVQTKRLQPTQCAGWQADQSGPSVGLTRFRRA